MASQSQLTFYFVSGGGHYQLARTAFRGDPVSKTIASESGDFNWRQGPQALALFFLSAVLWWRTSCDNGSSSRFIFRDPPASTLYDTFSSGKEAVWPKKLLGPSATDGTLISVRKPTGMPTVELKLEALHPSSVRVFLNDDEITSSESRLQSVADDVAAQWRTQSTRRASAIRSIQETEAIRESDERAVWTPKSLRLGIEFGVLNHGEEIAFSDRFLAFLGARSAETPPLNYSLIRNNLLLAVLDTTPVRIHEEELVAFGDAAAPHVTEYLVGLGARVGVFRSKGDGFLLHSSINEEVADHFALRSPESRDAFRRELLSLLRGMTHARFLIAAPAQSDISATVAYVAFAAFHSGEVVDRMWSEVLSSEDS